jgi:hypothetical protein
VAQKLNENFSEFVKQKIISMLIKEGYGTFAKRLKNFKLVVADVFNGISCDTAFMMPGTGYIVINPGFCIDINSDGKIFKQLSVVIRHEMLHFLLCHQKRWADYLKEKDPNFKDTLDSVAGNDLANYAMDYDISNKGYDDYDKQIVRNMQLNGRVIGGLLSEQVRNDTTHAVVDDVYEVYNGVEFNNWENKTMEEMYQMLKDAHDMLMAENKKKGLSNKCTMTIKKASHSQAYTDMYNRIMAKYDDNSFTDADLQQLLDTLTNGQDINI